MTYNKRFDTFELEQLLMIMFNISDNDYDTTDFEELVNRKFKDSEDNAITMENLQLICSALAPYAMVNKGITDQWYVGFACHKNQWMIAKTKATKKESEVFENRI